MNQSTYITRFTPVAQRDLRKVPLPEARKILLKLTELQCGLDDGKTSHLDIKALQNQPGCFRLRIGDYRAVYTVESGELIVWVLAVGDRGDIYRHHY